MILYNKHKERSRKMKYPHEAETMQRFDAALDCIGVGYGLCAISVKIKTDATCSV